MLATSNGATPRQPQLRCRQFAFGENLNKQMAKEMIFQWCGVMGRALEEKSGTLLLLFTFE